MKKKILLIIVMFIFITNVKALTFNVNLTGIEDKGSNTLGTITNINVPNKELDASFQGVGDEVNFELTITNSGDRVGILKSIGITSTNKKIEYTTNLPAAGLSINGNGTNKVLVKAKVLDGATAGTSKTVIKITYNYDEGSCPEGEILSEDETMCLCPNGRVRKDDGTCDDPEDAPECEEDEVYNETKKICEKITPPVTPENPKTLDNIVLITLLFIVSGLGIYALLFSKLRTRKQRVIAGITTSTITLSISFTALISAFGIDNLLGAIINPITKTQEIEVTVNETISPVETWDGTDCNETLEPQYIFEGGSGTESDPYLIKTPGQLVCFAKSITEGTTYQGQFVKQISDIKLNDNLVQKIVSGDTTGLNTWVSAGNLNNRRFFAGTYDGDNHYISGIYINDNSGASNGLFSYAINATFKNMSLIDTYVDVNNNYMGALVGRADSTLKLDNITTNGKMGQTPDRSAGIVGTFSGPDSLHSQPSPSEGYIKITNVINNISPVNTGIIYSIEGLSISDEPNVIFENVTNNGDYTYRGGIADNITGASLASEKPNVLIKNVLNNGNRVLKTGDGSIGGLIGRISAIDLKIEDSGNTGSLVLSEESNNLSSIGGLIGTIGAERLIINNVYNSGVISVEYNDSYASGVTENELSNLSSSVYGGLIGTLLTYDFEGTPDINIKNSFNSGDIKGFGDIGGILGIYDYRRNSAIADITVDNCQNHGDIYGGSFRSASPGSIGGLVGMSRAGTIKNSTNDGNILIWGYSKPYHEEYNYFNYCTSIGGLLGLGTKANGNASENIGAIIKNSTNEGNISITAKTNTVTVGGLCALCKDIEGSQNKGNITSTYATQHFDGIAIKIFGTTSESTNTGTITPGQGWQ